jgi:hypothetical protein
LTVHHLLLLLSQQPQSYGSCVGCIPHPCGGDVTAVHPFQWLDAMHLTGAQQTLHRRYCCAVHTDPAAAANAVQQHGDLQHVQQPTAAGHSARHQTASSHLLHFLLQHQAMGQHQLLNEQQNSLHHS